MLLSNLVCTRTAKQYSTCSPFFLKQLKLKIDKLLFTFVYAYKKKVAFESVIMGILFYNKKCKR